MIFRRSFVNELANSAGGVFTVVFSIVLTVCLISVLGATAGGRYDSTSIFEIMIYTGLMNLPPLLTVSLFIAVLMTMIRSWQESEMVVWFSAGSLNLLHWIRPVLVLAIPIALVVGALSLAVSPWAKSQIQRAAQVYQQRDDISRISAGQFIEASKGRRVFFIESADEDGVHIKNIFMSERDGAKEIILKAATGEIKLNEYGDRYVVLTDGKRYETSGEKNSAWRVIDFKRYELRLDVKGGALYSTSDIDKISFDRLIRIKTPLADSQLMWRLCWPFATLILALLAIPLSFTNPRAGRNLNLVMAALVFILYLNAISVGEAWVKTEVLTWVEALFLVNGMFVAFTLLLFVRRVWLERWLPRVLTELPYRFLREKD